jgi:hypothetical protein
MEAIKHPDYVASAEQTHEVVQALLKLAQNPEIKELGLDLELEKQEAEKHLRRAKLLTKLKEMTGFDFAVYDGAEMPGAAGFVKTNGEQTIYIAESVLDTPAFADHVAKHEAYHLKTMLVLPVTPDFSGDHFSTLNKYTPEAFENNAFYLEGFNEWLTANHDEQDESVTAYGPNVDAAKHLDALAYGATNKSLMDCFESGQYQGFAQILKSTVDRLMLYEAVAEGDYDADEKAALKPFIKLYSDPVASPEKADVIIESWSAKLKADTLKELLLDDEIETLNEMIASQQKSERLARG